MSMFPLQQKVINLSISINTMCYYPSTVNETDVCLALACNNDLPAAAVL